MCLQELHGVLCLSSSKNERALHLLLLRTCCKISASSLYQTCFDKLPQVFFCLPINILPLLSFSACLTILLVLLSPVPKTERSSTIVCQPFSIGSIELLKLMFSSFLIQSFIKFYGVMPLVPHFASLINLVIILITEPIRPSMLMH